VGQHLALEVGLHVLASGTFSVSRRLAVGLRLALLLALLASTTLPGLVAQRALDGDGAVAEVLVGKMRKMGG
jgi:hypothetical protein